MRHFPHLPTVATISSPDSPIHPLPALRSRNVPPACVGDAQSSCEGSMGVPQPPGIAGLQGFATPKHFECQNDCLPSRWHIRHSVDRHPWNIKTHWQLTFLRFFFGYHNFPILVLNICPKNLGKHRPNSKLMRSSRVWYGMVWCNKVQASSRTALTSFPHRPFSAGISPSEMVV